MALFPNSSFTFGAIINDLDFLRLGGSSDTFRPPFINGPAGLKYLAGMPYAQWDDFTEDSSTPVFDIPAMIMLGDIFGALYDQYRLPQWQFGGTLFVPAQQTLPAGNMLGYEITHNPFSTDATFGDPSTYNFGKMAFGYDAGGGKVYYGPWKWLNFVTGVVFSDRPNPINFVAFPKPGVQLTWLYDGGGPLYGAGMEIAGEVNSFYTGNLPALGH